MKRAKLDYEVWIGFPNAMGEINDITTIAKFNAYSRACDYLKLILEGGESDGRTHHGLKCKGEDFVEVASLKEDGKMRLSSPLRVYESPNGELFAKGVIE